MIFLTVACNFIDLKDVEGDRAAGIQTLPVMIGMPASQLIIATAFWAAYLVAGKMFADTRVLVFAALVGIVEFVLINRKVYREGPVFLVYLASLGFVLFYLAAQ